jgi:cytoskeletal protein CcmA (bactofilin family)
MLSTVFEIKGTERALTGHSEIKKGMSVNIMWKSSRTEDEFSTPANEPSTPGSTSILTVSAPSRAAESVHSHSTIGPSLVVKGELSGSEDLVVDGEVDGSIALQGQSLTVLPNGRVRANIEARNVILHGRVDGDIHASERVELLKSASLTGNISTARILIEDGAFFKGTIDMQKPEPAPKIQTKPPATATAAVPVAKQQGSVLERLAARKSRGSWSK